ncbi:hypothetical protein SLS60_011348 [Paraconiothyrium brasiliense]|uniref:Uncharacterized protein n=1 Tax=Paraconiothyrium brasiliense TaxID=300254 RepID=A0ABR3QJD9_9PLEO
MVASVHNYAGTEEKSEAFHYSQAVKFGNIVKTSGQGGWDNSGKVVPDLKKQVELAFSNVEKALQAADTRLSWKNVYAVRSFHISLDETADYVIENFRKFTPERRPVFTCVEIRKLGIEGMQVEIEVEALIES